MRKYGGYNVILLTSVGGSFPGTGFFFLDMYGFPESLSAFRFLSCHLHILIFLLFPLFNRFWSPGEKITSEPLAILTHTTLFPPVTAFSRALVILSFNATNREISKGGIFLQ